MIRAIAFDFDGVLAESVNVKTRAYAILFEDEKEETIQQILDYHLKNEGVSRFEKIKYIYENLLEKSLSQDLFVSLCDRYSKLVKNEVVDSPWVEGAFEFLEKYKNEYTFFVVSGTPEDELKEIIFRRGMEEFFSEVRGSPKKKDIILTEIIQKYGYIASELVFVGDAQTDWVGAKITGVPFIWRRVSVNAPTLSGFDGPTIPSLSYLSNCLSNLAVT